MFNEYLNHSNQCTNYYNVIRKEEINSQQNETNRFKQKWMEISSVYSSNSSGQAQSNSLQNNPINSQLIHNSSNSSNTYNSAVKASPISQLEDSNKLQQIQYQQQQISHNNIVNKQMNQSMHLQSVSPQSLTYYPHQSSGPYEQQNQNQRQQNNSMHQLVQTNMNLNNNQISKNSHYFEASRLKFLVNIFPHETFILISDM